MCLGDSEKYGHMKKIFLDTYVEVHYTISAKISKFMPAITVIMSVYNGALYLEAAVKSILAQTFDDFEFLIVNDASKDASADVLAQIAANDPRIRVLTNQTNLGLTASLNRACEEAQGAYIARMDADDIATPERFSVQYAFLEAHKDIAAVGSAAHIIDSNGKIIGKKDVPTEDADIRTQLLFNNVFVHSSLMIRVSCLKELGWYDLSFKKSQDYELLFRLSKTYALANISAPLLSWRDHDNSISAKSTRQQWDGIRARWYAITRYGYPFFIGIWYIGMRLGWVLLPRSVQRTLLRKKTTNMSSLLPKNTTPKVALFFTYGISLSVWEKIGMYHREIALYKRIAKEYGTVHLFTYSQEDTRFVAELAKDNIIVHPKPAHMPNMLYSWLVPFIHRKTLKQMNILKTNQMMGSWAAIVAQWLVKKPLIIRTGYTYSYFAKRKKQWVRYAFGKVLERFAIRAGATLVVATENEKAWYPEKYRHNIRIIPNFVDTSVFTPSHKEHTYRQERNLEVLFIGRFTEQKNLPVFFRSLSTLPKVHLTMIGQGEMKDELVALSKELHLDVDFLGNKPHDELPSYLHACDIFVLPSLYEGNPKVLLEAMATGCPVVGTDVEGISNVIIDGENGLLAAPTVEDLSRVLHTIVNTPELLPRLGRQAAIWLHAHYSLDHVIDLETHMYEEISV